jgi:hypothetical protein
MGRIEWLEIGSSFGSLTEEDERVWRKYLLEPLPLHICHEGETTKESPEVRQVEEERLEKKG